MPIPREREVVYDVPDYFDGTLTIMAVAFAADATGSAEKESIIRGPFVLTPSVPTVAAPGDQFEVGVTVANDVEGSGENAEVTLTAEPSSHLEIVQGPRQPLHIAEGRESDRDLHRARERRTRLGHPRVSCLGAGRRDDAARDPERAAAGAVHDAGAQRQFHERQRSRCRSIARCMPSFASSKPPFRRCRSASRAVSTFI